MVKETLIILLLIALIYYYRKSQKPLTFTGTSSAGTEELAQTTNFLKDQLNSNSLQELKTKLGSKTLDELLEENEDYETEVDTLTRTKDSLEADLTAQAEAFQARLREKAREIKKLKEDLTSEQKRLQNAQQSITGEKQQHKGSLERIKLLTEQITNLEGELKRSKSPLPGTFPETEELVKEHQEQLRAINLLFDEKAKDCEKIDFNGLYELLKGISEREREREREREKPFGGSKTDIHSPQEEKIKN